MKDKIIDFLQDKKKALQLSQFQEKSKRSPNYGKVIGYGEAIDLIIELQNRCIDNHWTD